MSTKAIGCKDGVGSSPFTQEVFVWDHQESGDQNPNNGIKPKNGSIPGYKHGSLANQSRFNKRPALPTSYNSLLNHPAKSRFIGSFIHEYNLDSRAKQRPSKRARQRMRKRLEKLKLEEGNTKISPDSGYDTTSGDCQTPGLPAVKRGALILTSAKESQPSPNSGKKPKKMNSSRPSESNISKREVTSKTVMKVEQVLERDTRVHSRTTSSSSAGSFNVTDVTLKKLLRDLHRCEVSIVKYESMLSEKCDKGLRQLGEVLITLRQKLDARENDLTQELKSVRESAAAILQRRKNTALYLKQAAESLHTLEDSQIAELKEQIKQFVTDRKVDEEIGTITRFQADPDDMLPHIMAFGKVNNVRHLYTKWEENPEEAIEMSKHPRLSFSCASLGHFRFSSSSICDRGSPSDSVNTDNDTTGGIDASDAKAGSDSAFIEVQKDEDPSINETNDQEGGGEREESTTEEFQTDSTTEVLQTVSTTEEFQNDSTTEVLQTDSTTEVLQTDSTTEEFQTDSSETRPEELSGNKSKSTSNSFDVTMAMPTRVETEEECSDIQKTISKSNNTDLVDTNADEATGSFELPEVACDGMQASQNEAIQEKEDDREVDDGPEKKPSAAELILKQARVRESLKMQGVFLYDPITGEGPPQNAGVLSELTEGNDYQQPISPTLRKRKTPTQLRRERKKRQKERERRQKELERKLREDSNNRSSSSDSTSPEVPHSAEKSSNGSGIEMQCEETSLKKKVLKKVKPVHSGGEQDNEKDTSGGESSEFEYCEVSSNRTQTETNKDSQDAQTNQFDEVPKQVNSETGPTTSSSLTDEIDTSGCLQAVPTISDHTINLSTEQQQSTLETVESVESDTPPSLTTLSEPICSEPNRTTVEVRDELRYANETETFDTQCKEQRDVTPLDENQATTKYTNGLQSSHTVPVACQQEEIIAVNDCSAGSVTIVSSNTAQEASSPVDKNSLSALKDYSTNVPQHSDKPILNDLRHLSDDLQLVESTDELPFTDPDGEESLLVLSHMEENSTSPVARDSQLEPLTLTTDHEDFTTDQATEHKSENEEVLHQPTDTFEKISNLQRETFQPVPLKDLATTFLDDERMSTEGEETFDVTTQDELIKYQQTPPNNSSFPVASCPDSSNSVDIDSVNTTVDSTIKKHFIETTTETNDTQADQELVPRTSELIVHTTDNVLDAVAKHCGSNFVTEPLVFEHPHQDTHPESESRSPDVDIAPVSTAATAPYTVEQKDPQKAVEPKSMEATQDVDIEPGSTADIAAETVTVETHVNNDDSRPNKLVDLVIQSSMLTDHDREE